jgi:hypothetical protein
MQSDKEGRALTGSKRSERPGQKEARMSEPVPVNTPSTVKTPEAPPVTSFEDRLREIMDTAQRLRVDAEWLQIDADGLLADLREIVKDPAAHNNAALVAALDSATWLYSAAENVQAEFSSLIDHLYTATEA